jgi:hypothetical protein
MTTEYGTFRCRICGREGFAPLPADSDVSLENDCVELTCSSAHTDQYDIAMIHRLTSKAPSKLLSKQAYAGAI